ncbi:MAG: toll/interleukin-1 receptor domain-containing protein [Anaerolineae bacterium]
MSVGKSVFISYRRNVSLYLASAIYHDLLKYGLRSQDVFLDPTRIDSGKLDSAVYRQIDASTHFVVVLTPATVERWNEASDWTRLEIEHALNTGRNVVVLAVRDFSFEDIEHLMRGNLAMLRQFPVLRIFHEHLEDGLPALYQRLETPLSKPPQITALPEIERMELEDKLKVLAARPVPQKKHLRAEALYDRGVTHWRLGDVDEALNNYNKALQLVPDYVTAYTSRGIAYTAKELYERALADFAKAMAIEAEYAPAYNSRGSLYRAIGYYDLAIADYTQAVTLYPQFDKPYNNRGELWFSVGHYEEALADFKRAEELKPDYPFGIAGMAITYHAMGNVEEAKRLWRKLIEMNKYYKNLQWVKKQLRWDEILINEASKLINKL